MSNLHLVTPSPCERHQCARTAPGGYCPPRRCYCGGCPHYRPFTQADADQAAVLSNAITSRRRRKWRPR